MPSKPPRRVHVSPAPITPVLRSSTPPSQIEDDDDAVTAVAEEPNSRPGDPIDYAPLRRAMRIVAAWLCQVARTRAGEPDDLEAIDRVEAAALATLDGVPTHRRTRDQRASQEDTLVVAGILIDVFAIDFRMPGLDQVFGTIYSGIDWILRSTTVDAPAPVTVVRRGHSFARHGDAIFRVAQALGARLVTGPRLAHGVGADEATRGCRRAA